MKKSILITITIAVIGSNLFAGYPVTDATAIANSKTQHTATIAKWVDNIAQLKSQLEEVKRLNAIQDEVRKWAGDPAQAAKALVMDTLKVDDLTRVYGETRDAITKSTDDIAALKREDGGIFRAPDMRDIYGNAIKVDASLYKRFSVLQARQDNARTVTDETRKRERSLQEDIAKTTESLRTATTDAEVQKLNAKLNALNGQLPQVEAARRREVDEVVLQQVANDAQQEVERIAAIERQAQNDYLANKETTKFMRSFFTPKKPAK